MAKQHIATMAKQHILIVEDSPYVAGSIHDALEAMGYIPTIAATAAEALASLAESIPDLVLLDWMLPDREGIEILRQIREGPNPGIPVVMLTARAELDSRLTGLEAGADDYLAKPFSIGELQARIAAILRRRS
jgi:two-component system phosphate regulon response regulator PhoB